MNYKTHRSIRRYQTKNLQDGLLESLLEAGTRASNTGNIQSYSVIVTREQAMKERLAPLHFNQAMVREAPVFLTFCVDYNRLATWSKARETSCGLLNLMGFYNASLDAMLFAQNVAVAAEEEGLGYCFLGTALYNIRSMIEVLKLPRGVMPILGMAIGYPAEEPEMRVRLPLSAVVHYEHYTPMTNEEIELAYQKVENDPFYQKQVADAGRQNWAQLVMEQQYTEDTYRRLSKEIIDNLREQGFEL